MEASARPDPREASPSTPADAGASSGLPPSSWRREARLLVFFFLAACVFSWPLAIRPGELSGLRGDYFNNLWNAWWVGDSITEGHSPYWTDQLYFPDGISLRRHTLSPLNSLFLAGVGALTGQHAAFALLVLLHVALSGWCFSLLAREVTGHRAGSVLGGLLYTFAPFHFFYLCQINVFSFEFLPLGLLFFLRCLRRGGVGNGVGLCLSLAGMATSAEYYVVYAYLTFGLLVLLGRWLWPEVPRTLAWRRALVFGGLGVLSVVIAAFPLLYATLGPERGASTETAAFSAEKFRTNDLLGFYWIGPKEECYVSWPTMLGYSTLALIVAGAAGLRRLWPWLLVGAFFFLLSLGNELQIGAEPTGVPMPYALFEHVPVLSMLRKSDRAFMMVQLIAGLALAGAFAWLSDRMRQGLPRSAAFGLAALVPLLEIAPLGLGRFEYPTSPYLETLAADPEVRSVMELPMARTHVANARFVYFQTLHHKKSTLGYTTALAVTPLHDQRVQDLMNWYWRFVFGRSRELVRHAQAFGVDRILHYKTLPLSRERDERVDLKVIWKPFALLRGPLLFVRQVGEFTERSLDRNFSAVVGEAVPELLGQVHHEQAGEPFLDVVRLELQRACGPALYEDDLLMVFDVPEAP
jgi:hypothetical protein